MLPAEEVSEAVDCPPADLTDRADCADQADREERPDWPLGGRPLFVNTAKGLILEHTRSTHKQIHRHLYNELHALNPHFSHATYHAFILERNVCLLDD